MSRRLGEILVDGGKITEAQLHRALTAQLVFGGHLGTSLLELGCIDEETLGETLAFTFGVPYADFEVLSKVPYSVIRALPAKLVEKHKVVPLRLEGKALHLGMIDPKNLQALDEISFVTGYRIIPWVSPEVRILQVLEKYYNLPRTQRYSTLTRELSRLKSSREKLKPLQSEEAYLDPKARTRHSAALAVAAGAQSGSEETGLPGDTVDTAETPAATFPPIPTPPPPGALSAVTPSRGGEAVVDHWEKYGYGRSWRELAEAFEAESQGVEVRAEEDDTKPQPRTQPRTQSSAPPAPPTHDSGLAAQSLLEVARRLSTAESVEEVVESTLSYLSGRLARSIVFVVKGDRTIAWAGRGYGIAPLQIKGLSFSRTDGPTLFDLASRGRAAGASPYLGAVPPSPAATKFYERLGVPVPRTILIVPILVKGRVTGFLYGDGGERGILAIDLPAVLSLCARAGFALQILILRSKILVA
ncbi:MAG TPA: hypothetical protein VGK94_04280 [Candidatus Polarisedimenticolia bacterium]|jgi:hypothetical protein